MASKRIRAPAVYIGAKKIGEISSSRYTHNTNQEQQLTDQGFIGFTEGPDSVEITFDAFIPVGGTEYNISAVVAAKQDVTIGYEANGGIRKVDGRITGETINGENLRGTQTGSWTFIGGKPKFT